MKPTNFFLRLKMILKSGLLDFHFGQLEFSDPAHLQHNPFIPQPYTFTTLPVTLLIGELDGIGNPAQFFTFRYAAAVDANGNVSWRTPLTILYGKSHLPE